MKRFKRQILAGLCGALLLTGTGCASRTDFPAPNTQPYVSGGATDSAATGVVCESAKFQLRWDDTEKQVQIVDRVTGAVWSPTPPNTAPLDENGEQPELHPQAHSDLIVTYFDPENLEEKQLYSYNGAVRDGNVTAKPIDKGLRVLYDFVDNEISVPVDYTVEDDCFRITVRPEEICDNGLTYVTQVGIAPFLCSLPNGSTDGYLFLPDGTGTIASPSALSKLGSDGSTRVYGDDLAIQTYDFYTTTQNVSLPVYGVKRGDNALAAIIESAPEAAFVSWKIGSTNIGHSSVYSNFHIRGYSYVESPAGFAASTMVVKLFDDAVTTEPLSVAFYPLSGEKANYVGMAECYRSNLAARTKLEKTDKSQPSVSLKYVGGVQQKAFFLGVPYTGLLKLTTLRDAAEMTTWFRENLNGSLLVDLVGFGKSGVDPGVVAGGFTVASGLGSKKDLRALQDYCNGQDIPLFLDFDVVAFAKSGGGYSRLSDATKLPNGQNVRFRYYDTVSRKGSASYYLLNRSQLAPTVERLTERYADSGLTGLSLSSLSRISYSDYATADAQVCGKIAQDVSAILAGVRQSGLQFLADAPNDYAAVNADYVIDAPLYSSAYNFSRTDVPFYQIVLRGYVPLNGTPINLSADGDDAILRCVESGTGLTYVLLRNYTNQLITTKYSFTYGCAYEQQRDGIVKTVNKLTNYYAGLQGAQIRSHRLLSDTLRVTEFDNGVYAVVNYGSAEAQSPYGAVPAHGYLTGRVAR